MQEPRGKTVYRQLSPAVVRSCARLDRERRLRPEDERPDLTTGSVQRVRLGNSKPAESFADLPCAVSKLKPAETLRRLVAILVGDDGNAGGPAAGVERHSDSNIAPEAVLQADRERVAAIHSRPAAFEKQPGLLLAAPHDRPLAGIEDEYRQFRLLNLALTGLVTLPLRVSVLNLSATSLGAVVPNLPW
jgi:hypothetical protein